MDESYSHAYPSEMLIFASFFIYSILHQAFSKIPVISGFRKERVSQYPTYIYSLVHSLVISISGMCFLFGLIPKSAMDISLNFTMGYVLYDIGVIMNDKSIPNRIEVIVHHVILYMMLTLRESFFVECVFGMLSEISTIFLNTSWIMYQSGNTNSLIFCLNKYAIIITYLIFRVVNFPVLIIYGIMNNLNLGWIFYLGAAVITILNFYWFVLLLRKAKSTKSIKSIKKKES